MKSVMPPCLFNAYSGRWPDIRKSIFSIAHEVKDAPSFAIIIPVHNAAATLDETLAGILPQLAPYDRVYIVENGSSDNSWEKLQAYRHHPGVQLIQISDMGASYARNAGIAAAREDYLMFCDADDIWASHRMAVYRSVLAQEPEADFACDLALSWIGDNTSLHLLGPGILGKRLWHAPDMLRALLTYTSFFCTSATIFKRSSLPATLFSPRLTYTQDFEAWCHWATHTPYPKVVFIDEILTYYRFEAGLSRQKEQRMANVYHIVRRYASRLPRRERYVIYGRSALRLMVQSRRNRAVCAGLGILFSHPNPGIRS